MSTAPRPNYLPFGRPNFSEAEIDAVARVLRSGWIGMGPETLAFEQELAEALGAPHVVAVSSCTAALFLSLAVQNIGPGDEVICPSLTWCSTANAAIYLGATPVFCDVDPDTLSVTPETVRAVLTPKTKAVVIVHFGGLAVDIEALRKALPQHVAIVEDAAHAFGARFENGRPVGSSGNATCFSFYANKNLATGEGGAVALANPAVAERLRSLRQHGLPHDAWRRFVDPKRLKAGELAEIGYKMNYTDLQAAIGRVQLQRQGEFAARRLEIARRYEGGLASVAPALQRQQGMTLAAHARHLYVVRLPADAPGGARDRILEQLRLRNIGASIHYTPLHTMKVYGKYRRGPLPVTEMLGPRVLTLPMSASMSVADADDVLAAIAEVLPESFPSPHPTGSV